MKAKSNRTIEVLAAHADNVVNLPSPQVLPTPEEAEALRPLLETARRLRHALVPVEPSATFVRRLGQELLEAASYQKTAAQRLRRGVVIGAAALGSVLSVIGVVVTLVVLRRRANTQPHPASS